MDGVRLPLGPLEPPLRPSTSGSTGGFFPCSGWAKAIREAGFPADLDADFDVDTFSGFLPCAYDGKPGGFEYFGDQVTHGGRADLKLPADYDFSVTFATHSGMRELATPVGSHRARVGQERPP